MSDTTLSQQIRARLPPPRSSVPYLRRLVASREDFILSPYTPHSWWHEHGRRSMVKRLESKGFPQLWGWLFLTLTIDPEAFVSEVEAYEAGCDRIRRMVYALRQAGHPITRYFSKLELHESGFSHWHVGLDCREYISNDEVSDAWGLGFTKTKRVSMTRDFRYLFKYVVKDNGDVPDWVLDYPKRIRVFQTSVGFYSDPQPASPSTGSVDDSELITLRVKFTEWNERGVVRVREACYRAFPVRLVGPYVDLFIRRVESGARALDAYHVPLQLESIEEYIRPWIPKPNRKHQPSPPRLASGHCRMVPTSLPVSLCRPCAVSTPKMEN